MGAWHLMCFVVFCIGTVSIKGFQLFDDCPRGGRIGVYKVYTRKTINDGECILPNKDSISRTSFDPKLDVIMFAHGYLGAGWNWYIDELRNALLAKSEINYVVVDWSEGSVDWLPDAYDKAAIVAKEVASFVRVFTQSFQIPYEKIHLIGHSMGGRVMGLAGNATTPKVGRITALDPLPYEYKGLARFTDVIHTTFIANDAVADANFFPNDLDIGGVIPWVSPHLYAIYMYTESVNRCEFKAHECETYEDYKDNLCTNNPTSRMGHYAPKGAGRGKMYLTIKKEPPFC